MSGAANFRLESLTDASDGWNEWSGELPYNNFAAVGTKNGTTSGNIYRKVQDDGIVIAYVAEKEVVEGEIYAYIKFDPAEGEGEFYFQDFICEEAPEVVETEETPTEDTSSESEEKTEEGVDTVESTPADDSGDDSDSEESSGDTANNEENN